MGLCHTLGQFQAWSSLLQEVRALSGSSSGDLSTEGWGWEKGQHTKNVGSKECGCRKGLWVRAGSHYRLRLSLILSHFIHLEVIVYGLTGPGSRLRLCGIKY